MALAAERHQCRLQRREKAEQSKQMTTINIDQVLPGSMTITLLYWFGNLATGAQTLMPVYRLWHYLSINAKTPLKKHLLLPLCISQTISQASDSPCSNALDFPIGNGVKALPAQEFFPKRAIFHRCLSLRLPAVSSPGNVPFLL